MTNPDHDKLLTTEQAAARMNLKPSTLRQWRCRGRGPNFYRVGDGPGARCRYPASELEEWLAERHNRSTFCGIVPAKSKRANR